MKGGGRRLRRPGGCYSGTHLPVICVKLGMNIRNYVHFYFVFGLGEHPLHINFNNLIYRKNVTWTEMSHQTMRHSNGA